MKKQIIGAIIIYVIGSALIIGISFIHEMTAKEVFQTLMVIVLIGAIQQAKETEKLKTEIKMLESRIDTLRDRINGTRFNS